MGCVVLSRWRSRVALRGFLHPYFRDPAASPRLKAQLDDPVFMALEQLRMLHDVQESALTYQAVAIAYRITTEFLVVKIQPEPNLRPAVIDVEGSGFGTSGDDKKHEQGLRELDPFRDSRLLGPTEQLGHCSIDRSSTSPGVCRRSAIGTTYIRQCDD